MNHPFTKLACYLLIGMFTTLYAALTGYDEDVVMHWSWYHWLTIVAIPVTLNGLTNLRTFLDGSWTRFNDAKTAEPKGTTATSDQTLQP